MADRTLVKNYLLDAAVNAAAPKGVTEQLAWLEARRVELSTEVSAGDWEISAATLEAGNASGRRNLNAHDRLAAVIAASERLSGADSGGSMLIIPQICGIHD